MTDRHVSLDGEGGYGEYRRVRGCFRREAAQHAETLAEYVGVLAPDQVHLRWQARHQQQQVGHGQTEEIIIRGGVHRLVARNHDARANVADDAREKDRRVDYSHRYHHV